MNLIYISHFLAVGSFIILRFFCPAIIGPENCGIARDPPPYRCRRKLVMVWRVLQALSQCRQFNEEDDMCDMNEFLRLNQQKMIRFFDLMSVHTSLDGVLPRGTTNFIFSNFRFEFHFIFFFFIL